MQRFALPLSALLIGIAPAPPAVADDRCMPCHEAQARGFAQTGMGQSLGRPTGQPGGEFLHRLSGTKAVVKSAPSGMRHKMERAGLTAEYDIAFYIGSGNVGRSYLIQLADRLFQSPFSYYASRQGWDMSPGYQSDREPDFNRPVSSDCLFCHSGRALPIEGSQNKYQDPPFQAEAISCERCHGAVERHLLKPSRSNVLNPRRLPARVRDSVCEQCHLSGEARILNPGREFWDFRPGMELEDVFSVYVRSDSIAAGKNKTVKVVSHSEQLAQSECFRVSGDRMWCGSCHDPHDKPAAPALYYRQKCIACHSSETLVGHPQPLEDCVSCHMPRRPAQDAPHTAFTDHRIMRKTDSAPQQKLALDRLAAWRPARPEFEARNLGLGYISSGERDQSALLLNEGFRILADVQGRFSKDPEVLTALGLVLLRKNVPSKAVRLLESVVELKPRDAPARLNLAIAQLAAGESSKAADALDQAISLDPGMEEPYGLLAEIHRKAGKTALARKTLDRYLQVMPQNMQLRRQR